MKVYISADIEGITGIAHWDEARKSQADYAEFRQLMTREVVAACDAALSVGATDILIKDAHASGRNILLDSLPKQARIIRGWSEHPLQMVQELDQSFDALMMIGYHSRAGSDGNPLAHTMSGRLARLKINDRYASEFLIHAYAAALYDVPVAFVSGDVGLSQEIAEVNANIRTFSANRGIGASTLSLSPALAVEKIREQAAAALKQDLSACLLQLPAEFRMEMTFKEHMSAYKAGFYPGAERISETQVIYHSHDYMDVLKALLFLV